jgi:hypothetical protein
MADRIIDRDIHAYTCFNEAHVDQLRRCVPSREAAVRNLINASANVIAALEAYRALVDAYPVHPMDDIS